MIRLARRFRGTPLLLAVLASCGGPRAPRAMHGMTALVTEDSAVFVMPSGWDYVPLPPPAPLGHSRLDYGWAVVVPSAEKYEVSAYRFVTDSVGGRGTPLERIIAPSRVCVCYHVTGGHVHEGAPPAPRVPREVTVRARGDDVVLTLKAAPAVRMVFGSRPARVWFRRYLRWPQMDSVLVTVRYTSPAASSPPGPPHAHP
jgi:hypothetical protein